MDIVFIRACPIFFFSLFVQIKLHWDSNRAIHFCPFSFHVSIAIAIAIAVSFIFSLNEWVVFTNIAILFFGLASQWAKWFKDWRCTCNFVFYDFRWEIRFDGHKKNAINRFPKLNSIPIAKPIWSWFGAQVLLSDDDWCRHFDCYSLYRSTTCSNYGFVTVVAASSASIFSARRCSFVLVKKSKNKNKKLRKTVINYVFYLKCISSRLSFVFMTSAIK